MGFGYRAPMDDTQGLSLTFDPSLYTRAPIFSVQEGISLARALIAACPKGMPASVKKAADKLEQRAQQAQTALVERQRLDNQIREEDTRALDQEMDSAFSGLRMRLDGYACLPQDKYATARRAAELSALLFGADGLAFLRDSYSAQLTTMDTLLKRISEDKLGKDLDALCGPEFLSHIRALLPRYERMVQALLSRDSGNGVTNLAMYRNTLSRSIVAYATAVCASVDEDDPGTITRALAALKPLDGQRNAIANRRNSAEKPESPPAPNALASSPSE